MKTRIITAIVALMLFIPALVIGATLLKVVIGFLSFIAIFELGLLGEARWKQPLHSDLP